MTRRDPQTATIRSAHAQGPQPTPPWPSAERAPVPTPAGARAKAHPVSLRILSGARATSPFRTPLLSPHPKNCLLAPQNLENIQSTFGTQRNAQRSSTQKPDTALATAQAQMGNRPDWPGAFWEPWVERVTPPRGSRDASTRIAGSCRPILSESSKLFGGAATPANRRRRDSKRGDFWES